MSFFLSFNVLDSFVFRGLTLDFDLFKLVMSRSWVPLPPSALAFLIFYKKTGGDPEIIPSGTAAR